MFTLRNACAAAWSVAFFFIQSHALPTLDDNDRSIVARNVKAYTGCTAGQEKKLKQDFADAITFAEGASGLTETDIA